MEIEDLLQIMVNKRASDLHLRARSKPVWRIDEELVIDETHHELLPEDLEELANHIMSEQQRHMFEQEHELDMAYSIRGLARFRVNIFEQRGTKNMVLRLVPMQVASFEELNLPPVIAKLADESRGLVLVTGTTGSGKSTTLASMVDYINNTKHSHIVTIEDPIEYLHKDKKSIISQREVGSDTKSFADALKHVIRQDPNIILIGEMRDLETISSAVTAAQMGHLVLSTLHTIDAVQTVNRIIDLFPPYQQNQIRLQLSDTLKGVISQRLLPHASGTGLILAVEIMVVTPYIKKLIEKNDLSSIAESIQKGSYYGMQTFNQALVNLYNDKNITMESALKYASNPEELMLNIRGIYAGSDGNESLVQTDHDYEK